MSNARAMVSIGDNLVSMDVTAVRRVNDHLLTLSLCDGTRLNLHPADITLYDSDSVSAMKMEEVMDPTYLPFTGKPVDKPHIDRALIHKGNRQAVVTITDIRYPNSSNIIITLDDKSQMAVHPKDLIVFDNQSTIMREYQERFMSRGRTKTVSNEDTDDYVFSF